MIYTPNQPIRALSWKEPFASLMLHGKIETRTWSTKYRGWVLICASKAPYNDRQIHSIAGLNQHRRIFEAFPGKYGVSCGYAIAIGYLANCRPMAPSDTDLCFVEYRDDLYCHIYIHVKPIVPFEWRGSQGWKTLGEADRAKIKLL